MIHTVIQVLMKWGR